MKSDPDLIPEAIDSRYPLIGIQSAEEQRVLARLQQLARERYGDLPVHVWTCTDGLSSAGEGGQQYRDPLQAIRSISAGSGPGFYVMQDLAPFLERPEVARALRDASFTLAGERNRIIFLVSPQLEIPVTLEKDVRLIQMPPPTLDELEHMVQSVAREHTAKGLPPEWVAELALSLKGLTLNEGSRVLHGVLSTGKLTRDLMLEAVKGAKTQVAGGSSYLQYVPQLAAMEHVGGLGRLKEWIGARTRVFTQKTLEAGLPIPKGILIMGVSGCGKSLCAKVVAETWRVPLFRLDMNMVHGNRHASPEATFDSALRLIESAAPAVLWIDEIENGLGLGGERGESAERILSSFLTWMQEKPPLVFVAATANRIEALPAELIRKGRFDQVFFCDLPNAKDRAEIFDIHLRHNQADPEAFDLGQLVLETAEWNAAEIEQAVIAGRIDATHAKRPFATEDVLNHCRIMVPLSRTMSEQIKRIRDWAWDRATPASEGRNLELEDTDDLGPPT